MEIKGNINAGYGNTLGTGTTKSSIVGGESNSISGLSSSYRSFIGGGFGNINTSSASSVIGGGFENKITTSHYSNIGGGYKNEIIKVGIVNTQFNFIGGGLYNTVSSYSSSIVGGNSNTINSGGTHSSVVGGSGNTVSHSHSHIIGSNITSLSANTTHVERFNIGTVTTGTTAITALAVDANGMVVDGASLDTGGAFVHTASGRITPTNAYGNTVAGNYSSVVGGRNNSVASDDSAVLGGYNNTVSGTSANSNIGGGSYNTITNVSSWSTVGGGYNNSIENTYMSFIGGGSGNIIFSDTGFNYNNISGGKGNIVGGTALSRSKYSNIGGGKGNTMVTSEYSNIGGGLSNTLNSDFSSIGGGQGNTITSAHTNSHIIGSNITSVSANTTHVERLNIGTVTTGSTSDEILTLDPNGIINTRSIKPIVITENNSSVVDVNMTEAVYPHNTTITLLPSASTVNNMTYSLPPVSAGLGYTFVSQTAAGTGVTITFDYITDLLGGTTFIADTDAIAMNTGVGIIDINNVDGWSRFEFKSDGVNWYYEVHHNGAIGDLTFSTV